MLMFLLMLVVPVAEQEKSKVSTHQYIILLADGTKVQGNILLSKLSIKQSYGILEIPIDDVACGFTRVRVSEAEEKKIIDSIKKLISKEDKDVGRKNLLKFGRKSLTQLRNFLAQDTNLKEDLDIVRDLYRTILDRSPSNSLDDIATKLQGSVTGELLETVIPVQIESIGISQIPIEDIISFSRKN